MYRANRVLVKTNTQEASEEFNGYFFEVVRMTGCSAEKLLELIRIETVFKCTSQRLSEQRLLDDIFANPEKYL